VVAHAPHVEALSGRIQHGLELRLEVDGALGVRHPMTIVEVLDEGVDGERTVLRLPLERHESPVHGFIGRLRGLSVWLEMRRVEHGADGVQLGCEQAHVLTDADRRRIRYFTKHVDLKPRSSLLDALPEESDHGEHLARVLCRGRIARGKADVVQLNVHRAKLQRIVDQAPALLEQLSVVDLAGASTIWE
jgi:hypothetical protein